MSRFASRRRWLVMLAALSAGSPGCASAFRWIATEPMSAIRMALHAACGRRNVLALLGRACGQCVGQRMHRSDDELAASFDETARTGGSFSDWYRRETIADFDAGRVVKVEGWVISETEFRILHPSRT